MLTTHDHTHVIARRRADQASADRTLDALLGPVDPTCLCCEVEAARDGDCICEGCLVALRRGRRTQETDR